MSLNKPRICILSIAKINNTELRLRTFTDVREMRLSLYLFVWTMRSECSDCSGQAGRRLLTWSDLAYIWQGAGYGHVRLASWPCGSHFSNLQIFTASVWSAAPCSGVDSPQVSSELLGTADNWPEGSPPLIPQPTILYDPDPGPFLSNPHNLLPLSSWCPSISFSVFQMATFLYVSLPKFCVYFSSSSFLHVQPISTTWIWKSRQY